VAGRRRRAGRRQAGDALSAQERVEHIRLLDVRQDDGPQLRCDATSEALADRDADGRVELFLDPHRRMRDELVPLLVQQQDGAGIRAEQRPDPFEELRGPVGAVPERRVGDCLQPVKLLRLPSHGEKNGKC
jgi:hypothetical protein